MAPESSPLSSKRSTFWIVSRTWPTQAAMRSARESLWKSCRSAPGCLVLVDSQIRADIEVWLDSEGGRSKVGLLRSVAEEFLLEQSYADAIIAGVAMVTRDWRAAAMRRGAPRGEIDRLAGAFEHSDLKDALALSVRD